MKINPQLLILTFIQILEIQFPEKSIKIRIITLKSVKSLFFQPERTRIKTPFKIQKNSQKPP